ncbi:unnamed protein product, partial [Discosporangium mesarthrocarpum]
AGARAGGPGGKGVMEEIQQRSIVSHLDMTYLHQWRGMPQSGPGSALVALDVVVTSVYLAPLAQAAPPKSGEAISLATPFVASMRSMTITAAPSWRQAGPAERWAGMQRSEGHQIDSRGVKSVRPLTGPLFTPEPVLEPTLGPLPAPEPTPLVPRPTEAAAAKEAAEEEAREAAVATAAEPPVVSRSISANLGEANEECLLRWRQDGVLDFDTGSGAARDG